MGGVGKPTPNVHQILWVGYTTFHKMYNKRCGWCKQTHTKCPQNLVGCVNKSTPNVQQNPVGGVGKSTYTRCPQNPVGGVSKPTQNVYKIS